MKRSGKALSVKVEGGSLVKFHHHGGSIKTEIKEEEVSLQEHSPVPIKVEVKALSLRRRKVKLEDIKEASEEEEATTRAKKKHKKKVSSITITSTSTSTSTTTSTTSISTPTSSSSTPFANFKHPTEQECREVCKALGKLHGMPHRPAKVVVTETETDAAACGEVPNVVQSIIRTILSQNTTQENGSRAYKALEKAYGKLNWSAIHESTTEAVAEVIKCGGLGNVKAKSIKSMLQEVFDKRGDFSLDYYHKMADTEVFAELVKFKGVGPKTASCVLLFCLKRNSFAVDTHIHRITKKIGWIPQSASREQAFIHLDERIPDDLKYALHTLFIRHGKSCKNCAANGKTREKKSVIQVKDCPLLQRAKKSKDEEKADKEAEDSEMPEYVVESVSLEAEGIGK